jgi:hypothetical protein
MASLDVLKRVMELSMEELKEEALFVEGEESVLHFAAANCFPIDAIVRLIEVVGIDAQGKNLATPAITCAQWAHYDLLGELANMKADLSIVNDRGENIFEFVNENRADFRVKRKRRS